MARFLEIWRRFWDSFVVASFAEAGEFDTAQKWAREWGLVFSHKIPKWQ
ncbi:hypothetical protein [Thermodesulfatator autotrophicus]|nr:hypothetical protein [Thermodesulfatator autotrophicus]